MLSAHDHRLVVVHDVARHPEVDSVSFLAAAAEVLLHVFCVLRGGCFDLELGCQALGPEQARHVPGCTSQTRPGSRWSTLASSRVLDDYAQLEGRG